MRSSEYLTTARSLIALLSLLSTLKLHLSYTLIFAWESIQVQLLLIITDLFARFHVQLWNIFFAHELVLPPCYSMTTPAKECHVNMPTVYHTCTSLVCYLALYPGHVGLGTRLVCYHAQSKPLFYCVRISGVNTLGAYDYC